MYEKDFCKRLSLLRTQKGVSAREMSIKIGQNANYINNIENGKTLPSMRVFFYICEYLNVTPQEFFDFDNSCPDKYQNIMNNLKKLSPKEIESVETVTQSMAKS